jgi:hypothetical protein
MIILLALGWLGAATGLGLAISAHIRMAKLEEAIDRSLGDLRDGWR